jgi:outer membrane lipase/esterase
MVNLSRCTRPKWSAIAAFGLALLLASPIPAFAQPAIGDIVTFGDSLSDPGNGFVFIRESATPPDYSTNALLFPSAPYARGGHHLSNGPTWIEQLARTLGLSRSANPAFSGSNPFAMNFAVGTARARNDGINPSLSLLVGAFLEKTGGVARADALYVIQIGANERTDACITPGIPPFTCKRPDTYLFWDGSHPTKAAHEIIAEAVAQLLGL